MSKPKLLATHPLFEPAREILDRCFDAKYWTEPGRIPRAALLRYVEDKEALICLLADKVDQELLDRAPRLRAVATVSAGFDNIDVAACTRRKVLAANTPGVLDNTTADLAWALILAVARRLIEGDAFVRSGEWMGWGLEQFLGTDVSGKTLGIIGFGRIGQQVARRATGFQMRVLYYNPRRAPVAIEQDLRAEYADLDKLLGESDFVSLHVPLSSETRHLISEKTLGKMKRSAFLINTARGPVVDEAALAAALEAGKIAGAALDVYEEEPKVHPGLVGRKNVVLLPHLGSASVETRSRMTVAAAENLASFFDGRKPASALNPEVLEKK